MIDAAICLWKLNKANNWILVETFPVDMYGYPTCKVKNVNGKDRNCWENWMWKDEDREKPQMSRAITMWSLLYGVKLIEFHPPQWPVWMNVGELLKEKNIFSVIRNGHSLLFGTENAVRDIIEKSEEGG
jgi:hypothetical protein